VVSPILSWALNKRTKSNFCYRVEGRRLNKKRTVFCNEKYRASKFGLT
jgi:hypothetical protein